MQPHSNTFAVVNSKVEVGKLLQRAEAAGATLLGHPNLETSFSRSVSV